ncbi:MAG: hypothetical protein ACLTW9_20075 [Enterocloster sp.]
MTPILSDEAAKGQTEEEVVESLGGPRIIARTIVDAALDTEDRPDGFETFGSEASCRSMRPAGKPWPGGTASRLTVGNRPAGPLCGLRQVVCQTHCQAGGIRWSYFLMMTVFFGIMGLAGWILSYIWPVLLVMLAGVDVQGTQEIIRSRYWADGAKYMA